MMAYQQGQQGFGSAGSEQQGYGSANFEQQGLGSAGSGEESEDWLLVNQVRQACWESEDIKSQWKVYCKSNVSGVLDPTKHTAESLKYFLQMVQGAEAEQGSEQQGFGNASSEQQ